MSLEEQVKKALAALPTKPRTYIVRKKRAGGKKRHADGGIYYTASGHAARGYIRCSHKHLGFKSALACAKKHKLYDTIESSDGEAWEVLDDYGANPYLGRRISGGKKKHGPRGGPAPGVPGQESGR